MKVINNVCEQHRGTKHQQVNQNRKNKYIYPHTLTQQLSIIDNKTKKRSQKVRHRNKERKTKTKAVSVFSRYLRE